MDQNITDGAEEHKQTMISKHLFKEKKSPKTFNVEDKNQTQILEIKLELHCLSG